MELKYKDMIKALNAVEEERSIPAETIKEALKEAMAKAYKKDAELADIDVVAEINETKQTIDLYQNYVVTEKVEDDELEISLEDAKLVNPDVVIGDKVSKPIEITSMSRAAATLAKNVMRQKIREAEKEAVYIEYIDRLNDMVTGTVESVKDKFTLINLGRTVAMMPLSAGIPGERLQEGKQVRVVITEVNKETKGSQVLVSRADPMFVKRLFEKEVDEIYQGIVEIKAIAREPGERTKMAVASRNPEVDPIGACIGPRGSRVQNIISELRGEKIDIFQWNEDVTELVKNALSPAKVTAVVPLQDEKGGLLVIVADDQLSLAIGKRGKNARLAVKLTNRKIDIKTRADIEKQGMDYDELLKRAEENRERSLKEAAERELKRVQEEQRRQDEIRTQAAQKAALEHAAEVAALVDDEVIPEEMQEHVQEKIFDEMSMKKDEPEMEPMESEIQEEDIDASAPLDEAVEETQPEEEGNDVSDFDADVPEEKETPVEPEEKVEKTGGRKHADLEKMAAKNTYVSVFEKLTDATKPKPVTTPKRRKKKNEEDDFKVRNKDLEEQIKKSMQQFDNRPVYSEEELAEIEAQRQAEEDKEYEFDYDAYEEYYQEDDD